MQSWPNKDPIEVLDYDLDWTEALYSADELDQIAAGQVVTSPADTIATSTFTLPSGITASASSFSATKAKVWLSGGTDGQSYQIKNEIVTAGGRTFERTVKIKVKSK